MGTRYDIGEEVVLKRNSTVCEIKDIRNPGSDSPTYILVDEYGSREISSASEFNRGK